MTLPDEPQLSQTELADISALADGSLEPERRAAVQGRIDGDPAARKLFERDQLAAQVLAQARASDRASAALRTRIEADRAAYGRAPRRPGRAVGLASAAGAALAAAAALAILLLGTNNGAPAAPSVSQMAALALRGSSMPAPAPDPANPTTQLRVSVGTLHFPNYTNDIGASAVGERADELSSRRVVTVYYSRGGHRIAYSIISGPPLLVPSGQNPAPGFVALQLGPRTVLTWRRDGHTCVLSATNVPVHDLLAIASWTPTVPAEYRT